MLDMHNCACRETEQVVMAAHYLWAVSALSGAQHEDIREGPTLSLGHNTYTIYNIFVTTLIQLLEIFNQYNNTHVTQQYKTFTQTLQNIGTIIIFNILQ